MVIFDLVLLDLIFDIGRFEWRYLHIGSSDHLINFGSTFGYSGSADLKVLFLDGPISTGMTDKTVWEE